MRMALAGQSIAIGRVVAILAVAIPATAAPAQSDYDPLALPVATAEPLTVDLVVHDADRDRDIPLLVHLPPADSPGPHPVILFSHGLGGSRTMAGYLGRHWSARGSVVGFLQHPGSDVAVWQSAAIGARMRALQAAASAENLLLRLRDVRAVLDQLEAWQRAADHPLAGKLDMARVGMAGHSFGAQTTQGVAGQSLPVVGRRATDARIRAAVIMSPGTPRGGAAGDAFAGVTIPWLLLTGTRDTSPIGGQTVESRLAVFPALPAGNAFQLVLDGAEHHAFTDFDPPALAARTRDPAHHRAILAVSTAFWDAFLREDRAARDWLSGDGPRSVLAAGDTWERK